MRFLLTIGRLVLFDFTLFQIDDPEVIVVHKYPDAPDADSDGPEDDIFGGGKHQ